MNSKKKNFNFSIILTACIKTVNMLPFLERTSVKDRLNDYKETFNKWCQNEFTDKIIFIENSGYDLSFFNEKAKEFSNKTTFSGNTSIIALTSFAGCNKIPPFV